MSPMASKMDEKAPGLFERATSIANGILSRLKKSFDIHSPSRATRRIFNQVMEGARLGTDEEIPDLLKSANSVSESVLTSFRNWDKGSLRSIYTQMRNMVISQSARLTGGLTGSARWQDRTILSSAGDGGELKKAFADAIKENNFISGKGTIKATFAIDGREFAIATSNYIAEEMAFKG